MTLFAVIRAPVGVRDIATYLSLLGCGVIAIESTRTIKERKGTAGRDMQSVWYLAIAITLPPAYAFFAPIPLMAYHLWRVRRVFAYRRIFSNAAISLAYGAGSWAFHLIPASAAGAEPGSGLHVVSWTGLVAATGAVAWAINVAFVIIAIKLSDQKVRVRDLVGNRETASSDLIELSLAVSLSLVVAINPVLMVLAVPSVVLYRRYLMNAQFVAQARMDGKTGVLNADSWRHEADVEVFRAQRTHTPLALVMVGIDHFSSVTDTAGHDGADQVLRGIANVLTQNLQGAGIIGRVGTQEFAMLLPQAGQSEARRLAERVRDHIAGEPIAIEDGAHAGFVFRLTVSIGIAVLDHSKRALAELIGAADTALTVAKTTGRNRVCIVPDGSSQVL
ncbi:MAG TPA: GGDEF domain-containing protein [Streptosporangiaceae bacterium]|nr:GGDEF domain-containing protein [Streptosporangiaceae bacterium]